MQHKPRLDIHMEKQLGWTHKFGGAESMVISKVGQTMLARLMGVSDMAPACGLCGSVRGGFRKGTMASAYLDASHFSFSPILLVPFKLLPWCWSSEGVSLSR